MSENLSETAIELVFLGKDFRVFDLEKLLSSSAETLGKGTFGYTYVVDLESWDDLVVVKRFKVAYVSETEFVERVELLGKMAHENLLPVQAYCCQKETRRLVYDYMPMGSVFSLLHGSKGMAKTSLSWEQRAKIAYGVACGINYLHSVGPNVCHGNIRSSNVFLTEFYDARLSEFGLAQLISSESKALLAAGYRAPELTFAHQVSQQSDVYSFGVLLLELLTGESVSVNLPGWVRSTLQEKPIIEVFDNEMKKNLKNGEQMVVLLQVIKDKDPSNPSPAISDSPKDSSNPSPTIKAHS